MRPDESNAIFTELTEAFPHLQRRFNDAPRVLAEWTKALRPLAAQTVSEGISRWVYAHDREPTLAQFLELLDTLATERHRGQAQQHPPHGWTPARAGLADTLAQVALGAQTDDDRAWAQLHVTLFMKGLATDAPDNPGRRAMQYEAFAEQHPALAGLALQTAEQWGV